MKTLQGEDSGKKAEEEVPGISLPTQAKVAGRICLM